MLDYNIFTQQRYRVSHKKVHFINRKPTTRHGNDGVSQYPRYQKIFWLTVNFNQDYRHFVAEVAGQRWLFCFKNGFVEQLFCPKISHQKCKQCFFLVFSMRISILQAGFIPLIRSHLKTVELRLWFRYLQLP